MESVINRLNQAEKRTVVMTGDKCKEALPPSISEEKSGHGIKCKNSGIASVVETQEPMKWKRK